MSRGQTPRHRHDGPHPHRMGAQSSQTARRLPRGFLWPRGDRAKHPVFMKPPSRGAWRCKRGRRALTPWPCGRTAALAIAARRNRARGHCRTPTRRSRRMGRQAQRRQGHSRSTCCGSARLAQRGDGSPITTQLPHARPGRATRARGAVDCASRARLVSMPCRVGSRADGAESRRGDGLAAPRSAGR